RVAAALGLPLFMGIRSGLTISGSCPARDHRGRVTEPQSLTVASIVSRRAGRFSHLAWGTGNAPDPPRSPEHHNNRSRVSVFAAGVVLVATAVLGRAGIPDRCWAGSHDRAGRSGSAVLVRRLRLRLLAGGVDHVDDADDDPDQGHEHEGGDARGALQ